MKIFRTFLILIIIAIPLTLGYFGLIPAISKVLGTNKPRDLGKTFNQEVYNKTFEKANCTKANLEPSNDYPYSVKYEDFHEVEISFSDDELTSVANSYDYKDACLTSVQIRINPDGSAEGSGIFSTPALVNYLINIGIPAQGIATAMEKYPIPKHQLPFYVKGTGSVINNQINMDLSSLELGRIPVPQSIISTYQQPLADFIENQIFKLAPDTNMEKVTLENGKLNYKGKLPGKISAVRK